MKEERLIYNHQTSSPNNEPTNVGLSQKSQHYDVMQRKKY